MSLYVHSCLITKSFFLDRFLAAVITYLVAGALIMYFAKGARGVEIIPNYHFWKDFPFLIKVRQAHTHTHTWSIEHQFFLPTVSFSPFSPIDRMECCLSSVHAIRQRDMRKFSKKFCFFLNLLMHCGVCNFLSCVRGNKVCGCVSFRALWC